jgi:hypothetical protein
LFKSCHCIRLKPKIDSVVSTSFHPSVWPTLQDLFLGLLNFHGFLMEVLKWPFVQEFSGMESSIFNVFDWNRAKWSSSSKENILYRCGSNRFEKIAQTHPLLFTPSHSPEPFPPHRHEQPPRTYEFCVTPCVSNPYDYVNHVFKRP